MKFMMNVRKQILEMAAIIQLENLTSHLLPKMKIYKIYKTILPVLPMGVKMFSQFEERPCIESFWKQDWKISEPMSNDVTDQFRVLHSKEPCNLYRSTSIVGAKVAQ
jgi:hypothetical protein